MKKKVIPMGLHDLLNCFLNLILKQLILKSITYFCSTILLVGSKNHFSLVNEYIVDIRFEKSI